VRMNKQIRRGCLVVCGLLVSPLILSASDTFPNLTVSEADKRRMLTKYIDAHGETRYQFNLEVFDQKLEAAWMRARNYPPTFTNVQEQAQTVQLVKFLIGLIAILTPQFELSGDAALRAARIYSMAYNLDLPEAFAVNPSHEKKEPQAIHYYELALKFNPNDAYAHWHYGAFLGSTDSLSKIQEGAAHLERAVALGLTPAMYSLGLVYLQLGNRKGAIESLERYAQRTPSDKEAKKLLDTVRSSLIERVGTLRK